MDSRAAGAKGGKLPHSPRRRGLEERNTRAEKRTRPPSTQRRGAASEPQARWASRRFIYKQCAGPGGEGRQAQGGRSEHPTGTPLPDAPAFGVPQQARGTRTQGVVPLPTPCRRRTGTSRGVPSGRGRSSPRLPKVRRPPPQARSPWSRPPARDQTCSRAAGLRRRRPGLPSSSGAVRPCARPAGRRQVREPERALPGRCLRRFLPEGCGALRAGGPESAPCSGRRRRSARRAFPPSQLARRSPPLSEPAL